MQMVLMYIIFCYLFDGVVRAESHTGKDAALEKKINHHRLPPLQVLENCVRVRHAGR